MNILIFEDEQISAMECKEILEENGHDVLGVHASFGQGQDQLDEADLVLMDIRLDGEVDGIEAGRRLNDQDVPVIYVTAHSDSSTLSEAQSTYPAGYIVKPYTEDELLTAIETASLSFG